MRMYSQRAVRMNRFDGSMAGSVRRVTGAFVRYLGARAHLAQTESAQAGRRAVQIVALGVGAAVCAVIGYLSLVAAFTAWMAVAFYDGRWPLALLTTAGIHLAGMAALYFVLRRFWRRDAFFPATRREFKEDQKWITTNMSGN